MQNYQNLGGDSGVASYETGADFIKVKFTTGKIYTYNYASAGGDNVELMKTLAANGKGLNSFIMKNVRTGYV